MVEHGEEDSFLAGDPAFYEHLLTYDPTMLEESMRVVRDAIESEINFEPIHEVPVRNLLDAAAQLLRFVEEYEKRVGSIELPPPLS